MPVALLGGLDIEISDTPAVAAPTRKAMLVLASLCLFEEQGVARASLAEWIWPDRSEDQARSSLRQALSALRKSLPSILPEFTIETDIDKLVLAGPPQAIDIRCFARLARSDQASDWIAAAKLYRGDLLDGVDMPDRLSDTLLPIRMRLRSQALDLIERLSADPNLTDDGRVECEELANRLLRGDVAAEEAHRALIRLRLAKGQVNSARKQLELCIRAVKTELGTEPEAATLKLIVDQASIAREAEATARTPNADGRLSREAAALDADPRSVARRSPETDVFQRPAVLFLPFEALSRSDDDALLALGLCEDIRTTLACWRSFPVIGPEALGGATGDVQSLAAGVDATYVVTGSVRRAGNRARVIARLIDSGSGQELWSQSFDGDLVDVFDFQDELSRRIVSQIEPEISRATAERIAVTRPKDLATWELLVRAVDAERRGGDGYGTQEANNAQRAFLAEAIERDSETCEAWARLARCYFRDFLLSWAEDGAMALDKSLEMSARAVEIDPSNSVAQACRAQCMLFGCHDPVGALEHAAEATRLNPSNVVGHIMMGCVLVYHGEPDRAYRHYELAL